VTLRVEVIDVTPAGWGEKLIASFLVTGEEKTALVDVGPASSYPLLKAALEERGVEPDLVIVTHIHLDHAGAAGHLLRDYPQAKLLVHPRGAKHMINPSKLWTAAQAVLGPVAEIYGEPLPAPPDRVVEAGDNSQADLGGGALLIAHTPGHASHHMSIQTIPGRILFTGDSAGVSVEVDGVRVVLPTTPPPFRLDLYLQSIDKMISLQPDRPAPTHYGILQEPAIPYLQAQKEQATRWYETIKELARQGILDVDRVAEKLAEKFEDAARTHKHPNPIISQVFYRGTVWGMLEAKELGLA